MKRKRRWLSAILAIAVLLAFAPMGALATEEASSTEAIEWNADEENQSDETIAAVEHNDDTNDEKIETVSDEDTILEVVEEDSIDNSNVSEESVVSDETEEISVEEKNPENDGLSETKVLAEEPMVLLRASGDGEPKVVDVSITNFEIQNLAHQTADSVYYNDTFYLAMDWDASGHGATLQEGDYFDVTLPENMSFPSGTTARDFNLTDEDGNIIATAHVTPGEGDVGGTVHVTFTDAAEGRYNVKGTMYLAARFDRTQITIGETNTFSISINGEVTSPPIETEVIVVGPKELQDEYLAKWGQSVTNEPNMAEWYVRINHIKATLSNVILTDSLNNPEETYIPDSFVLSLVEFDSYGNVMSSQVVDISDKITLSEDLKSFTLNLGDINGEQYRLRYRTTYTPGTVLRNALNLNSTELDKTFTATHISADSGGTGGGDLASKIKLIKVDENDETIVLAGAVFEVTAPDGSTFQLTTGADGTVTSGLLTQGAYKVREVSAPVGYELNDEEFTLNVSQSGGAIQTVTNHLITTTISGSKTWDDNNNQDGTRPRSITIHLLANGTEVDEKTVTAADNWSWTFDNLPKFEDGSEITYSVREDAVDGYTPDYDGYDVTNTHTPGKTSVSVSKAWDDANDQDGIRPTSITVKLLADDTDTGKTEELNEGNQWTATFTDLEEFKSGKKIVYTIEEVDVTGYTSVVSGDAESGYTITNSHTPEVTNIDGSKTWDDNNNQDGVRSESITIRLLANGTEVDSKTVTEADNWSWSFTELPKFESGKEIVYTVTEDAVSDYSTTYDGFNVTNTHAPGKTSVTVTKKWDDSDNKDGIRPDSVTVNLLADGTDTGQTLEISASNNWSGSFTDLDEYKNGEKINYTVVEKEVTGYVASVSGDAETGFVITNTHEPKTPTTPSNPDKPNKITDKKAPGKTTVSTSTKHPKTGDKEHMPLYLGILAVAMVVLIASLVVRRRKEEA